LDAPLKRASRDKERLLDLRVLGGLKTVGVMPYLLGMAGLKRVETLGRGPRDLAPGSKNRDSPWRNSPPAQAKKSSPQGGSRESEKSIGVPPRLQGEGVISEEKVLIGGECINAGGRRQKESWRVRERGHGRSVSEMGIGRWLDGKRSEKDWSGAREQTELIWLAGHWSLCNGGKSVNVGGCSVTNKRKTKREKGKIECRTQRETKLAFKRNRGQGN